MAHDEFLGGCHRKVSVNPLSVKPVAFLAIPPRGRPQFVNLQAVCFDVPNQPIMELLAFLAKPDILIPCLTGLGGFIAGASAGFGAARQHQGRQNES